MVNFINDDAGQPSKALLGFCKKLGIEPGDLVEVETPKGVALEYQGLQKGQSTAALLPALVEECIKKLPLPKRMRWGNTRDEFTRPVLWLVALWGTEVLPLTLFGRNAGRATRGHRVHSPGWIELTQANEYFDRLRDNRVIADFAERQAKVAAAAKALSSDEVTVVVDNSLLREVTALVEWPVALMGSFNEAFLDVPREALISSMKEHQKYFHVENSSGELVNRFVTMANLESKDPQTVVQGNERVLNARLSDAKFFWDTDLKTPLKSRKSALDQIVFHVKLGTLGEKCARAGALARHMAPVLQVDRAEAEEAAVLAKCDLVSEMVLEFGDLQGLMGSYYATREGYAADFAQALQEIYKPAGANDDTPKVPLGATIALADKLDTLTGLFAVGQPPTGSKDPFALRRSALGILRIMLERDLSVDLNDWISASLTALADRTEIENPGTMILSFFRDRLKVMLKEQGIQPEVFEAVAQSTQLNPVELKRRAVALQGALGSEDLLAVAASAKRISNLLAKAEEAVQPNAISKLTLSVELELKKQVDQTAKAIESQAFENQLNTLATLRGPIDQFFDTVLVNSEDPDERAGRLALLAQLRDLFQTVADLSQVSS